MLNTNNVTKTRIPNETSKQDTTSEEKSRLQTNVHGVHFAPSPPVADHSLDVVDEQTRNLLMTPRDGQDLQKDLNQAIEYVGSAAQVGPANEGVVALAPPPTWGGGEDPAGDTGPSTSSVDWNLRGTVKQYPSELYVITKIT
jgi:hypothetical protein